MRFLKAIWAWITSNSRQTEARQSTPQMPIPVEPASPLSPAKFAFLIGHTEQDQGARNYKGESEWIFNTRVAKKAMKILAEEFGLSSYMLFHGSGSYSARVKKMQAQCKKLGVEKATELHFNAFSNPKTQGVEALIVKTATLKDDKLARLVTDMIADEFDLNQRGHQGVRTIEDGHSGGGMARGLDNIGVINCIIEPLFATHDTEAVRNFFDKEDEYARILAKIAAVAIQRKL